MLLHDIYLFVYLVLVLLFQGWGVCCTVVTWLVDQANLLIT